MQSSDHARPHACLPTSGCLVRPPSAASCLCRAHAAPHLQSPARPQVRLEGPANLWSLQALAARRSQLYSDHAAAAVAAYLRASGRSAACRIAWNDTAVTQQWSLA